MSFQRVLDFARHVSRLERFYNLRPQLGIGGLRAWLAKRRRERFVALPGGKKD